jgi:uncharacterized membrane protein
MIELKPKQKMQASLRISLICVLIFGCLMVISLFYYFYFGALTCALLVGYFTGAYFTLLNVRQDLKE